MAEVETLSATDTQCYSYAHRTATWGGELYREGIVIHWSKICPVPDQASIVVSVLFDAMVA